MNKFTKIVLINCAVLASGFVSLSAADGFRTCPCVEKAPFYETAVYLNNPNPRNINERFASGWLPSQATSTSDVNTNPRTSWFSTQPADRTDTNTNATDRSNSWFSSQPVDRTEIANRVKDALRNDSTIGNDAPRIIVVLGENGVLILRGEVSTSDLKSRAENVAKKINGVRTVDNQLNVSNE